jgi:hypothetical protein
VQKPKTQFVVVPSECKLALKRKIENEDIAQELILDCNYISDDDISSQCDRDSDTDSEEDNRADIGCRDWTNITPSQP